MRALRKKELFKGNKSVVYREYITDDNTWFLIENGGAEAIKAYMEFELDGYTLENPDEGAETVWTIPIEAGANALRHVLPEKKAAKAGGGGMGMFSMGALMDEYANVARSYKFKATLCD